MSTLGEVTVGVGVFVCFFLSFSVFVLEGWGRGISGVTRQEKLNQHFGSGINNKF